MKNSIQTTARTAGKRRRSRRILLAAVVATGTAALSIALSISFKLERVIDRAVDGGGRRILIANADMRADSSFDWQMPPAFEPADTRYLLDAGAGIREVSVINELNWRQIEVNGEAYRPGPVLGSDENYADVMGLTLVAGSFFSSKNVEQRERLVVLSERAAIALFGDVQSAVGKSIRGDRNIVVMQRMGGGRNRQEASYDSYTVSGVFADSSEFERDAYGIPDYIIPYTVMFPSDMPIAPFVRTFAARSDSRPLEGIEAGLGSSLSSIKDDDSLKLSVWEGSVDRGGASSVEGVRNTLRSLSTAAQLFGLAILIVASFGIVSGMIAEAAERKRELAVKRAIGLSSFSAAMDLCYSAVRLAAAGAVIGFVVSLAAGGPITAALQPFLEALGVNSADLAVSSIEWGTLAAPFTAVCIAAVFSFLPALSSASRPIVEGLQ